MKYLGTYQSNLSTWHLQELMKLLEAAFQQGEYAAGQTFDDAALAQLRADGQAFGELPTASAGQRVTDDALNRPFDLLRARFEALLREASEFDTRAALLLTVLEKDSALVDQLLFAAALEYWASKTPQVGTSQELKWDFGMGHGHVATDVPVTDPLTEDDVAEPTSFADLNGVEYPNRPPVTTFLTDRVRTGLVAPADVRRVPVKYLAWSFTQPTSDAEVLYGADWAKLSLLEAKPLLSYAQVTVESDPASTELPFAVVGSSLLGGTPVYVRAQFTVRRNQVALTLAKDAPVQLSSYAVSTDDVVVAGPKPYMIGDDYTVTPDGVFTPIVDDLDGQAVTIYFLEYYPSYQCSINQRDWSPVVMFDPTRPYPDDETLFRPIAFGTDGAGQRTLLPVTDEIGNPTGFFLSLTGTPQTEYLLKLWTPGNAETVGATAKLEVEFARPTYLNAFQLAPFTTFPLVLKNVELEGLTADTKHSVFSGMARLDRQTVIRFERGLVRRIYLTFYQENYTLKEYQLESADALRREVMTGLQSALPYAVRRSAPPVPVDRRGALYEFGVEDLEGQDWTSGKGIVVSGPHRLMGSRPEVLRLDADIAGTVDVYLYYRAFNTVGAKIDENIVGISLTPNVTRFFPLSSHLTPEELDSITRVDVYLKLIPRTVDALIERFLLQMDRV